MTRPTTSPTWGGTQTEPSGPQKAAGFSPGDRVPAQWFNWIFDNFSDWIQYLDVEKLTNVDWADAGIATFGTRNAPNEHPGSPSNLWRQVLAAKTNKTNTYIRLLVGDGDNDGCWAFSFNAVWNPASGQQYWSSDNTGLDSTILLSLPDGFQMLRRAAGAGTWTSWPTAADLGISGNLSVGGSAAIPNVSGDVLVAGTLSAGNDLNAVGDIFAGDDVIATGDFQYATPPSRTVVLPLASAIVAGGSISYSSGRLAVSAPGTSFTWPLRPPAGAVLGQVDVMLDQSGGTNCVLQAIRQTGINWGAPSIPSATVVAVDTGSGSTGVKLMSVSFGALAVSASDDLSVLLNLQNTGDKVLAVRVTWTDPGPRNH